MFRVLLPNGRLTAISGVEAMVEESVTINGRSRNMAEPCLDLKFQPTAVKLSEPPQGGAGFGGFGGLTSNLLIGNLKAEVVNDILQSLMSSGYYSFADFQLKEVHFLSEAVMDKGESAPYLLRNYFPSMPLDQIPVIGGLCDDKSDGVSSEDDRICARDASSLSEYERFEAGEDDEDWDDYEE